MSTVAAYADRFMRSQLADARTVGMVGVVLGVLAFWIAIPPFTVRTPVVPVVIGVLAIAAGGWAVSQGERRSGWGAVAGGVLGAALGVLATHSSTTNLTSIIEGLVVLFVGADVLILAVWNARRKVRIRGRQVESGA